MKCFSPYLSVIQIGSFVGCSGDDYARVAVAMEVPAAIYCWYFPRSQRCVDSNEASASFAGIKPIQGPLLGMLARRVMPKRQHWLEQMKIMASAERKGQLWCWDGVYGEARFLQDPLRKATEREGAC